MVFLRDTLAPQFGVTIRAARATARCSADTGGLLGLEGTNPALEGLAVEVEVRSSDAPERLDEVFAAWRERCPIYLALLNPNDVAVSFSVERDGATDEGR